MRTMHKHASVATWLGLTLALSACDKAAMRQEVDELKRTKSEVSAELKEQLESAKKGAAEVKEDLPSRAQVRAQLEETAHDVKGVVKVAGEKVKEQAREVRDELREHTKGD